MKRNKSFWIKQNSQKKPRHSREGGNPGSPLGDKAQSASGSRIFAVANSGMTKFNICSKVITFLICTICIQTTAHADMYRWVDEDGVTHYTQHPPKKGDMTKIPPPLKAASTADEESKRFLELDKKIQENNKQRKAQLKKAQQTEEQQKILSENCQRAKRKIKALESSNKVRDEHGNLTVMTPEGKKATLVKTQAEIDIYCQ